LFNVIGDSAGCDSSFLKQDFSLPKQFLSPKETLLISMGKKAETNITVSHRIKSRHNHQKPIIIEIVQLKCPAIVFNALKMRAIIKLLTVHKRPSVLATMNACI